MILAYNANNWAILGKPTNIQALWISLNDY